MNSSDESFDQSRGRVKKEEAEVGRTSRAARRRRASSSGDRLKCSSPSTGNAEGVPSRPILQKSQNQSSRVSTQREGRKEEGELELANEPTTKLPFPTHQVQESAIQSNSSSDHRGKGLTHPHHKTSQPEDQEAILLLPPSALLLHRRLRSQSPSSRAR